MRRFFLYIFSSVFAVAAAASNISIASAQTLTPGTLIRGSGPAVYFYATSQKRYAYPSDKVFKTWYSDFSKVVTIDDTALASIPLGGNVTYKPGELVKLNSDSKVYVVASGSTLRWVKSASVAATLFGKNWAQKIHDLPDAFFVNYQVGSPVQFASDIDVATQRSNAPDFETELFRWQEQHAKPGTVYTNKTYGFDIAAPTIACASIYSIQEETPDAVTGELLSLGVRDLGSKTWSPTDVWFVYSVYPLTTWNAMDAQNPPGRPSFVMNLNNGLVLTKWDPQDGPTDLSPACGLTVVKTK